MHRFDAATALERRDGRFAATLDAGFNVGRSPNGGYVAALGVAAIGKVLAQPDPFSVTTHYLRRLESGPVEVEVDVVREGRSLSAAEARLYQGGAEGARMLAVFGDLSGLDGPTAVRGAPPDLPPPDELVASADVPGLPEIVYRLDLRIHPAHLAGLVGQPSGGGEVAAWMRFADGREPDVASLPLFADAGPPAALNLTQAGWVPTIELTVHVRARPAPGWLRAAFRTRYLVGGYLEEDGELWDSRGDLVALSRQLARVHRPRES